MRWQAFCSNPFPPSSGSLRWEIQKSLVVYGTRWNKISSHCTVPLCINRILRLCACVCSCSLCIAFVTSIIRHIAIRHPSSVINPHASSMNHPPKARKSNHSPWKILLARIGKTILSFFAMVTIARTKTLSPVQGDIAHQRLVAPFPWNEHGAGCGLSLWWSCLRVLRCPSKTFAGYKPCKGATELGYPKSFLNRELRSYPQVSKIFEVILGYHPLDEGLAKGAGDEGWVMSRLKSSGSKDHVCLLGRPFERNPLVRITLVVVVCSKEGVSIYIIYRCVFVYIGFCPWPVKVPK